MDLTIGYPPPKLTLKKKKRKKGKKRILLIARDQWYFVGQVHKMLMHSSLGEMLFKGLCTLVLLLTSLLCICKEEGGGEKEDVLAD